MLYFYFLSNLLLKFSILNLIIVWLDKIQIEIIDFDIAIKTGENLIIENC